METTCNEKMGRLFLHCGLHKTGSTAIQATLARYRALLAKHGLLYPDCGGADGAMDGHHNLAWEIARDRRFVPGWGGWTRATSAIRDFPGDAVLSSEDFESALSQPGCLKRILAFAEAVGRDPVLVLYLRNQQEYLPSLYLEMMKHGFGEGFDTFLEEVCAFGQLRLNEWVFQFDYLKLLEELEPIFPGIIVVRNYHALGDHCAVRDILSVLPVSEGCRQAIVPVRLNPQIAIGEALTHFYRNRIGRCLDPGEAWMLDELRRRLARRPAGLGPAAQQRIAERFSAGNGALCAAYQVPENGLAEAPDRGTTLSPGALELGRIFSFETGLKLAELAVWCRCSGTKIASGKNADELGQRLEDLVGSWLATA